MKKTKETCEDFLKFYLPSCFDIFPPLPQASQSAANVAIRDDTDENLAEETQQVAFFLRLSALFVAENRPMETKHSLVDTQNYRMP